jgi:four helix bundle protein
LGIWEFENVAYARFYFKLKDIRLFEMAKPASDNIILKKTFDFSLSIISFCEILDEKKKWALSGQLFRSGTSIGANVREAQNSESNADFIHKFKIAAKECEETKYWLELCQYSKNLPDCSGLIDQLKHIENIISKIIITSKSK